MNTQVVNIKSALCLFFSHNASVSNRGITSVNVIMKATQSRQLVRTQSTHQQHNGVVEGSDGEQ